MNSKVCRDCHPIFVDFGVQSKGKHKNVAKYVARKAMHDGISTSAMICAMYKWHFRRI